jgi:NAD(P)-dependent dehydrogenase (short-subunit alcohol dehydrogenase family)
MLSSKNILVTGASSGIGKQIAIDCALNNANLFLCARRINELQEVKCNLQNPSAHLVIAVDITKENDIHKLVDALPILDGVILNAGLVSYRPITLINEISIRQIFSINFDANVLLLQHLLKSKKIRNGASIIFIGSISAHLGNPGTALYAASKAAISAYSKVLASELSIKGIRSNVISPGLIKTEIFETASGLNNSEISLEKKYPLGIGIVSDVSNQAVFLLSSKSRWITGTDIIIDGGYTLTKEI